MQKSFWMAAVMTVATLGVATALFASEKDDHYVKRGTWLESMIATHEAMAQASEQTQSIPPLTLFTGRDYTFMACIKTRQGGTIVSLFPPEGGWKPQGKSLFVDGRGVVMDIGYVGAVSAGAKVTDDRWHHVALAQRDGQQSIYVDGRRAGEGQLKVGPTPAGSVYMLLKYHKEFRENKLMERIKRD
jgi:hypothetical protein